MAHLPPGQQTDAQLEAALRSPQLQQALRAMGAALHGDNFHSLLASMGIDAEPGTAELMRGDAVAALIACLTAAAPSAGGGRPGGASGGSDAGSSTGEGGADSGSGDGGNMDSSA